MKSWSKNIRHFLKMGINNITNRIRKRVSFELGKEKEKYIHGLVISIRQRKNSKSP